MLEPYILSKIREYKKQLVFQENAQAEQTSTIQYACSAEPSYTDVFNRTLDSFPINSLLGQQEQICGHITQTLNHKAPTGILL